MPILTILCPSVLMLGSILAAFARPRSRRSANPTGSARREWRPISGSLSGVPLRHALDEMSGPGAVVRDALTIRPPWKDENH